MGWRHAVVGAVLFPFVLALSASAQVTPVEEELAFRGSSGETVVRTLNLRTSGPASITFVRHDLIDEDGRAIPVSSIALDPATFEVVAPGVQQVRVSITLPARAGTYNGYLDVESEAVVSVPLEVTVDAAPAVTVSPASLVLRLAGAWNDLAFVGSPTAEGSGWWTRLGRTHGTFDLQQSGPSPATIESINVVGLRQADGDTLPAAGLAVEYGHQVPARDALAVNVDVSGRNLEPGEYTGTIAIAIADQPTVLDLPFTLKVKDGWPLALVTMLIGILVALAFNYWSAKGYAYIEAARKIQTLAKGVDGTGGEQALPAAERDEALRSLSKAAAAIDNGALPTDVTALISAADALINVSREKVAALLVRLDTTESEILARSSVRLKELYTAREKAVRDAIRSGKSASIAAADADVLALETDIDSWKAAQARFDALGAAGDPAHTQRQAAVDAAASLAAYKAAVDGAVPPPGMAGDDGAHEPETGEGTVSVTSLPRLRRLELLIWSVTLLFVLALGWITLYMAADTFGADAKDYLSVFLWGTVTSGVFGKAVGFGDLQKLAFPGS